MKDKQLVRKVISECGVSSFNSAVAKAQNEGWTVCPNSLSVALGSYSLYSCFVEALCSIEPPLPPKKKAL